MIPPLCDIQTSACRLASGTCDIYVHCSGCQWLHVRTESAADTYGRRSVPVTWKIVCWYLKNGAQSSVVGTANLYGLEGPGFEPRSGQGIVFSPYPSRPVMGPPSFLYNGYWGLLLVVIGRVMVLTARRHLALCLLEHVTG